MGMNSKTVMVRVDKELQNEINRLRNILNLSSNVEASRSASQILCNTNNNVMSIITTGEIKKRRFSK